nr:hypothetical protein CFP56_04269 [Quercus suber]
MVRHSCGWCARYQSGTAETPFSGPTSRSLNLFVPTYWRRMRSYDPVHTRRSPSILPPSTTQPHLHFEPPTILSPTTAAKSQSNHARCIRSFISTPEAPGRRVARETRQGNQAKAEDFCKHYRHHGYHHGSAEHLNCREHEHSDGNDQ